MGDPINVPSVNLSDLARVMGEIGKQAYEMGPMGRIYQDEGKVYAKLGKGNRLITVLGQKGKSQKDIHAIELVQIAQKTIDTELKRSTTDSSRATEFGQIASGLEALRERITVYQNRMSPVKRFILNLFGVLHKTDILVKQIDQTIDVAKKFQLKFEIDTLSNDIQTLRTTISDLEERNKTLSEDKSISQLEKEAKRIKSEIASSKSDLEKVKAKFTEKQRNYLDHKIKLDSDETNLNDTIKKQISEQQKSQKVYEEAQHEEIRTSQVEGAKKIALPLIEKSPAQLNYAKAKEKLKETEKKFEADRRTLSELRKQKASLESKIEEKSKAHEKEENHFNQDLNRVGREIEQKQQSLDINQSQLADKKNKLEKTRIELEQNISTLASKEEMLASKQEAYTTFLATLKTKYAEKLEQAETKVKVSSEPTSSLFTIPAKSGTPLHYHQARLIQFIKSNLGLTSSNHEHEILLRKLIFGFSIGQKQTIKEITKSDASFTVEELEKMLEGGGGLVNMFYVAHYLDQAISSAERAGKDPKDLVALKRLQADIKRSLPFILRMRSIELSSATTRDRHLKELSADIREQLEQLQAAERLLLPVGTNEHMTLLSLEKKEDRSVKTVYYNTGEGVEENLTTGLKLQTLTDFFSAGLAGKYPVKKTYRPFNVNDKIDAMLISVMKNQMVGGSIADINRHLDEHLGEGKSGEAKDVQISNVCSFQVLTEAFEDILCSDKANLSFQHGFLSHLQARFETLTKQKTTAANSIEVRINQKLLTDNQREIERIEQRLLVA